MKILLLIFVMLMSLYIAGCENVSTQSPLKPTPPPAEDCLDGG